MDPLQRFRESAHSLLRSVLTEVGVDIEPEFEDAPQGFGDLALPCFPFAKIMKKAPNIIARELASACERWLKESEYPLIASVEAVNGYLNISFNESLLLESTLTAILQESGSYGKGSDKGESIILEHTSANPNGPFHVGRARNPIIGDSLGRILSLAGYDVTTEYYVNDMGKQAVTLAWGVENLGKNIEKGRIPKIGDESELLPKISPEHKKEPEQPGFWREYEHKTDHLLVSYYQRASKLLESDPDILKTINTMLESYEKGNREIGETVRFYCDRVLAGMRRTLEKINVSLDAYAYESKFVYNGDVTRVIDILGGSEFSHEDEGARYLELEDFDIHGRDTRFFYTRREGSSLYTTRDLAYHLDKFTRGDRVVDILGEDHKLQAQQLGIALGELGISRRPEAIFYAFVSLPEGKMSTRKGRVVYLDQLIEEALERAYHEVTTKRPDLSEKEKRRISELVGIGAIRYNIVRVQMEKSITFKWEEALSFEGDSAPFIQYSHARACSILRKAGLGGNGKNKVVGTDGIENNDVVVSLTKNGGGTGAEGDEETEVMVQTNDDLSALNYHNPYEIALIRALAEFPAMVQTCAAGTKIHPMAAYIRDIAQLFNQFYRECPVISAEGMEREARLVLVRSFKMVVSNGLNLLGIDAPEFM